MKLEECGKMDMARQLDEYTMDDIYHLPDF